MTAPSTITDLPPVLSCPQLIVTLSRQSRDRTGAVFANRSLVVAALEMSEFVARRV